MEWKFVVRMFVVCLLASLVTVIAACGLSGPGATSTLVEAPPTAAPPTTAPPTEVPPTEAPSTEAPPTLPPPTPTPLPPTPVPPTEAPTLPPPPPPVPPPGEVPPLYDDQDDPVSLMASYINAINRREYDRAWNYWENPPNPTFDDFRAGYADTASVLLAVHPPTWYDAAAGSAYAQLPVLLLATHTDASQHN